MNLPLFVLLQAAPEAQNPIGWILIGILLLVLFVVLVIFLRYLNLYIQSLLTRAGIGLLDMIAMNFRKVSPAIIVRARIMAVQAGLEGVDQRNLEAHYLAGGNVLTVITALISADRAGLPLDFKTATGIDLAGRDVLDAKNSNRVRASSRPPVWQARFCDARGPSPHYAGCPCGSQPSLSRPIEHRSIRDE